MDSVFVFVGLVVYASDGKCDFAGELEVNGDTSACCFGDLVDVWGQSAIDDDCYSRAIRIIWISAVNL